MEDSTEDSTIFISAAMELIAQSEKDRKFLDELMGAAEVPNTLKLKLLQIQSTLTLFETVVRNFTEQQMQILEGLQVLVANVEEERRAVEEGRERPKIVE